MPTVLWWTAEVLSSARQTGRLEHLSFTWQQQKSWNCRRLASWQR